MIFIKIFRINLKEFLSYLKTHKIANITTILAITISSILSAIFFDDETGAILLWLILFPIYLYNLIKDRNTSKLILTKNNKDGNNLFVSLRKSLSFYLLKYLKFSLIILTIFTAVFFYVFISSLISWFFILYNYRGLVVFLFLTLSLFLVVHSFSLIFNLFFILTISEKDNLSSIKAIFNVRKKFKKYTLSHLLSVCIFGLGIYPIMILADKMSNILVLSSLFIGIYTVLLINYAMLDVKNICEEYM